MARKLRTEVVDGLFGREEIPVISGNVGAYASVPGSGPKGETCGSCRHSWAHRPSNKRYWKCGLVSMTHGPGTDIRLSAPACLRWQMKPTEEKSDAPF